jgi:hypothetical protein
MVLSARIDGRRDFCDRYHSSREVEKVEDFGVADVAKPDGCGNAEVHNQLEGPHRDMENLSLSPAGVVWHGGMWHDRT